MADERASVQGVPSAEAGGSEQGRDLLATRLSELSRQLQQEHDVQSTHAEIVASAVEMIPGAEEGSISVVMARKHVDSHVPSGQLPHQVDAVQNEVGEGPCLDAVYEQQTVRVSDLRSSDRWPRFSARAAELGVLSMLSFQLYVEGDNLGSLNLYAREANAFDDESEHVGLLFAAHAAVAFADAQQMEQLKAALASRDVIGQAKGILMERLKVTPDQAFLLLSKVSQETNTKLHDLAEQLVRSGTLEQRDVRG